MRRLVPLGLVGLVGLAMALGLGLGLAAAPARRSVAAQLTGPISAPGGPFLVDGQGRVVILHGVDAVYKHAPFELYDAPGKPWNFSTPTRR